MAKKSVKITQIQSYKQSVRRSRIFTRDTSQIKRWPYHSLTAQFHFLLYLLILPKLLLWIAAAGECHRSNATVSSTCRHFNALQKHLFTKIVERARKGRIKATGTIRLTRKLFDRQQATNSFHWSQQKNWFVFFCFVLFHNLFEFIYSFFVQLYWFDW